MTETTAKAADDGLVGTVHVGDATSGADGVIRPPAPIPLEQLLLEQTSAQ